MVEEEGGYPVILRLRNRVGFLVVVLVLVAVAVPVLAGVPRGEPPAAIGGRGT